MLTRVVGKQVVIMASLRETLDSFGQAKMNREKKGEAPDAFLNNELNETRKILEVTEGHFDKLRLAGAAEKDAVQQDGMSV